MRSIARRCLAGAIALALSCAALSAAADPPFIPWSSLLPGLTFTYEPSSANACQSGDLSCVDAVIAEMTTRFNAIEATCDHNTLFALTYLRTTEEYKNVVVQPGFFSDPNFINHQDANFARLYFERVGQLPSRRVEQRAGRVAAGVSRRRSAASERHRQHFARHVRAREP